MGKTSHPTLPALDERLARWTASIPARRAALDNRDAARYVSLYNSTFARKITSACYEWRYAAKANHAVAFAVDSAENFAGVYGFQLFSLAGAATVLASFPADVIVDSSARGSGLVFSRLKQEIESETARLGGSLVVLFPNPAGAAAFRSDPHYVEVSRKTTYLRDTARLPASPATGSLEVQKISRFGQWIAPLLADFAASHPSLVFVNRSETYLNWRFAENPIYSYDIFRIHSAAEPFAWLVLKSFTDPISGASFGDIVDLIWRADSPGPLAEILCFALDWFHRRGVPTAAIWLESNTLLDRVAAELGFVPSSQSRPALIKVLNEQYAWLRDPSRWFLTMSDSEVY